MYCIIPDVREKKKGEISMKKITTGIALQLASVIAGANHYQSEFNLTSTDRNLVAVSLDNNQFSEFASNLTINDIQPGFHYVRVVKRYFRPVNRFSHYFGYRDEVVYNGYIEVPVASRVIATLDYLNRFSMAIQNTNFNGNNFNNTNYSLPYYMGMEAVT
ncbi:MAG: hypothetical protein JJE25_06405, partial [Bacteroidia bacterium]|nr:hypothetical protein [Bacteroidia bacterium]